MLFRYWIPGQARNDSTEAKAFLSIATQPLKGGEMNLIDITTATNGNRFSKIIYGCCFDWLDTYIPTNQATTTTR